MGDDREEEMTDADSEWYPESMTDGTHDEEDDYEF